MSCWDDPPEYPEPPDCCGAIMDEFGGVFACGYCGRTIEPPPEPQDARDAACEAKFEDMRERMAEEEDYDFAADDLAYDAARERGSR